MRSNDHSRLLLERLINNNNAEDLLTEVMLLKQPQATVSVLEKRGAANMLIHWVT